MTTPLATQQIVEIFSALLDSDDVREDDSYFDVGGTSITALTLVARLNQASGARLRLRDVIRSPSPAALAAALAATAAREAAVQEAAK
ncbi:MULTISPECIES: acyl carrier protein [Kitasatospora]|uniref:acyl carrier protein n=1 Tax=Kitasatospora TaxID=2063 RepID=UPI000C70FC2E|nr:acyl carrier protein [Kitasatospora sp. GP30]MDH6140352.1 acyl carrier protein [Kitasatospora sp. GP30]